MSKTQEVPAQDLEEGRALRLDFSKLEQAVAQSPGILPVAVQDADTGAVLLVAYTNRLAFEEALQQRELVLWSTSRGELWHKGATSGATFELVEVRVNCEQNSLLYRVRPKQAGMCHTQRADGAPRTSCFYRRLDFEVRTLENLEA
ncbi:MAG: phosphoribosyl-AMP cyclohydrolase [Candidatus Marinimicrobia bacterium]|nr:phosphoribosyl-AMP cyclohydrolase [Candidatus Neomarinimicrobiota bacterium]